MVNEVKNTDIFVFRILSYQNVHTFTNEPVYIWPYTLHM